MRQAGQNNQMTGYNADHDREKNRLIIDGYLSKEILRPFCGGLGLLALIFTGYSAALQLGEAAQGALGLVPAVKLVLLNTLVTLEILMPSALFFSVLAALSRMHRDSEMNALYAAGISQARIMESVLKLALVMALITGFISMQARPWAYRESYRLESQAAAEFDLKKMATGQFVNMEGSDYIFIARGLDLEQGLHKKVFLQKEHPKQKRTEIIIAEAAAMPVLNPGSATKAEFYNGYNYLLDNRQRRDVTVEFKRMTIHLEESTLQEKYRRKAESTRKLALSESPKDIAEYQWRISTPLATILLALVAVPLGRSEPREPRFRRFFIALSVYLAIFTLASITRTWIEQERLAAFPGLWGAYGLIGLLLLVLLKAPRLARR